MMKSLLVKKKNHLVLLLFFLEEKKKLLHGSIRVQCKYFHWNQSMHINIFVQVFAVLLFS